ncbi:hypothetical protein HQN89_35585 [Paenibacillus frigoriresistens]|uniref:hypothetical protein n=1 Tax=Paenibacillus alginolyticus TaxID=59839 RepID=UPI001563D55A|nr:hypothetical protein [Paenibacillus frigoriresistens]NRF96121.1 hypothetical protein [Paenibacillus frigoriresistens]
MITTNETYESVYGKKYSIKIENLRNQITTNETGIDTFRVINIEAGLGKSVETNRIIREYLECFEFTGVNCGQKHRKFLIVKRFSKDVEDAEHEIGKTFNSEWQQKVIGITGENWIGDWQIKPDLLVAADVIIITHARYVLLCSREEERSIFIQGRHTLIIDERIDFTKYSFKKKLYDEMISLLPFGLHSSLFDVSRPLFNEIEKVKQKTDENGKKLYNKQIIRTNHPKKQFLINQFKSLVGKNMPQIQNEHGEEKANQIREFINSVEVLYSENAYFNNGSITGCNLEHHLWSLSNNIILDANGSIEKLYKSDEKWNIKFILDKQSLIVDHSHSSITHIKFNSSKNKIEELDKEDENEYFAQITALIKKQHETGQRLLFILQKQFIYENNREGSFVRYLRKNDNNDIFIGAEDEAHRYNGENIAINWFGNVIGKNDWRDFDQCWILGTPNIPMETHVINLAQYSNKNDWRMGLEMIRKHSNKYIFKNNVYEDIRIGYLVGEIYQAIKRIQRNPIPRAKFFIVNNDEEIFNGVIGLIKNIKVLEPITIKLKKKDKEASNMIETSTESDITMKILMNVLKTKGDYPKSIICDSVGIDKSHLNRYFNKNIAIVKSHIDSGDITIGHHKIIRH